MVEVYQEESKLKLDVYGLTHAGNVRLSNEDFIQWTALETGGYLAVLADGMGGYDGGAVASQLAVENFIEYLQYEFEHDAPQSNSDIPDFLFGAGVQANQTVRQYRFENPELSNMGTTLVAIYFHEDCYWILHAGDSRCYRVSGQKLDALTRDHSLVQEMLKNGSLSKRDSLTVPFRSVLTKAIGPSDDLEYSLAQYRMSTCDSWLLCSDGLYNSVSHAQLLTALRSSSTARQAANTLLALALDGPAQDNVSVIVIKQ